MCLSKIKNKLSDKWKKFKIAIIVTIVCIIALIIAIPIIKMLIVRKLASRFYGSRLCDCSYNDYIC